MSNCQKQLLNLGVLISALRTVAAITRLFPHTDDDQFNLLPKPKMTIDHVGGAYHLYL